MMLISIFLARTPSLKVHQSFHKAIVEPYELSMFEKRQCALYSRLAHQQMKDSKYQSQLVDFADKVDITKSNWLHTSLFSADEGIQLQPTIPTYGNGDSTFGPAYSKTLQYKDKEWKNDDIEGFIRNHVPTFADVPVQLEESSLIDVKTGEPFEYVIVGSEYQVWLHINCGPKGTEYCCWKWGTFRFQAVDPRQMSNLRMELGGMLSTDGNGF